MVTDALRRVMLAADGAGELEGDDVICASSEHPVCGDWIEVDLRLRDGVITDLAWRAQGCPAAMAVAAAAREALHGCELRDAGARLRKRVADLGGLGATEQHALAVFERALAQASRQAGAS